MSRGAGPLRPFGPPPPLAGEESTVSAARDSSPAPAANAANLKLRAFARGGGVSEADGGDPRREMKVADLLG